MNKKIIMSDESRTALLAGAQKLVDAVKITLGPKGRNVVLERGNSTPLITNDGVTIAKEIELKDKFENLGASIIKEVCIHTNNIAGDGTTTASVLAQSILKDGIKNFTAGANPILLREGISKAINFASEKLKSISTPIEDIEKIKQVATVSSQDEFVGNLIGEAINKIGKDGSITLEESSQTMTELKIVEGLQFDRGYISPYFCTDNTKMEANLINPYILITNKKLTSLGDLVTILEKISHEGASLLIVADDIDGDALATLVLNKVRGTLNVVGVKSPSFGDRRNEELQDLATFVGAKFIMDEFSSLKDVDISDLGHAKRVNITKDKTTIIEGMNDTNELNNRIEKIKEQILLATNNYDKDVLKERLGKLVGGVAVIKVGAITEVEMKEKKLRIEDALNATKSAISEGIVPGGGVALLSIFKEVKDFAETLSGDYKLGAMLVANSLSAPLKQICLNAGVEPSIVLEKILNSENKNYGYDALNNSYVDMISAGIIDPTLVTRSALQNAGSIASTMLTTECLIVDDVD